MDCTGFFIHFVIPPKVILVVICVRAGRFAIVTIDIDFDTDGQQEVSFESDDAAFQLKFGGRYDFSDRWFAEGGATYLAASSVKMELPADSSQTIESDYQHWTVTAGVGFRF